MTKPNKTEKPSSAKAPAARRKGQVNPILDVLKNMDDDVVAMLRLAMREEMDVDPAALGPQDPVDLFAEYIEVCTQADVDEDEKSELLADLVDVLGDLRVDSNGGDREAREQIQAIYDLLDNAIEGHALRAVRYKPPRRTPKVLAEMISYHRCWKQPIWPDKIRLTSMKI